MAQTFPSSYKYKLLHELPQPLNLPHYYYPGALTQSGRDGLMVEVSEDSCHWVGTFAFGNTSPKGITDIFAMPDEHLICVVAKGAGILVRANDPILSKPIPLTLVTDVRSILARELIVFVGFTEMVAYGRQGLEWRTQRLTWDGLEITSVSDRYIQGQFWDIRSDSMEWFTVDLTDGTHQGGIGDLDL